MAYAIMRIEKIKTQHELVSRYNHNYRVYDVANANDELSYLNREPVDLMGKTYVRAFEDEIFRMQMEGNMKNVRKNAVLGFEVMLTYSRDAGISVDDWIDKNVTWLQKTFNPPENKIKGRDSFGNEMDIKSNNVKSVVVHLDESTPHIHAFVVPIDNRGKLNAHYYLDGRNTMINLQNDYAKTMSELKLKRGTSGTKARHENVARYYIGLNRCVSAELPSVEPGESADEYKQRADVVYQDLRIHYHDEKRKNQQLQKEMNARGSP